MNWPVLLTATCPLLSIVVTILPPVNLQYTYIPVPMAWVDCTFPSILCKVYLIHYQSAIRMTYMHTVPFSLPNTKISLEFSINATVLGTVLGIFTENMFFRDRMCVTHLAPNPEKISANHLHSSLQKADIQLKTCSDVLVWTLAVMKGVQSLCCRFLCS